MGRPVANLGLGRNVFIIVIFYRNFIGIAKENGLHDIELEDIGPRRSRRSRSQRQPFQHLVISETSNRKTTKNQTEKSYGSLSEAIKAAESKATNDITDFLNTFNTTDESDDNTTNETPPSQNLSEENANKKENIETAELIPSEAIPVENFETIESEVEESDDGDDSDFDDAPSPEDDSDDEDFVATARQTRRSKTKSKNQSEGPNGDEEHTELSNFKLDIVVDKKKRKYVYKCRAKVPGRGPGRPRTRPIKVPDPNRAKRGTKIGIKHREIIPKRDKAVRYVRDDGKERPHVCDVCGKRFTRDGGLVLHKRIHDPNFKRFECETCGKSFVQKSQLEVHMKIHKRQYDYVCKICNKGTDLHVVQFGLSMMILEVPMNITPLKRCDKYIT